MVFGIDPIYIMLMSILAMACGFAAFGFLLFRMYLVLIQMRDHLGIMSTNPHIPAVEAAPVTTKQGVMQELTARDIIKMLAQIDPLKNPVQAQYYAKMLYDEMVRLQRAAGEETVSVSRELINAGLGRAAQ